MSKFFTDTDCELWYTDVDKYDMNIIEMPYTLDSEEQFYDMGRKTDFKKLFDRMREGAIPSTSALNPQSYVDYFEPHFKNGDDVLYVHFSDQLSGTFEYMKTAYAELKEKYPERELKTFNTKNISLGGGFIALEAAKMHKAGKSDEEIIEFLEEFAPKVNMVFVVDSLSHLKRGGRISGASAVIGSMLNIKPILKITEEGKIEKCATAKGMKKAINVIVDEMVSKIEKTEEYSVVIMNADNKELADYAEKVVREKMGEEVNIAHYPIGPVIGAHCGPGTVGLVYYGGTR